VAPNTWAIAGEELPSGGAAGDVLSVGAAGLEWKRPGGDVGGSVESLTVRAIQGRRVSEGGAAEGDVLTWSEVRGQWEPRIAHEAGMGVLVSGNQIGIDGALVPIYQRGLGSPGLSCLAGRDYYVDISNEDLYYCGADGIWRLVSKGDHRHTAEDIEGGVLGLARGGTNQANWVAGRCVQVSGDGTRLESASAPCGGGGQAFDPVDQTVHWLREEFTTRNATNNQIGTHGWASSCSGGSIGYVSTGSQYNRTYIQLATGATSGNWCRISLGGSGTTASAFGALGAYSGWVSVFRFALSSITNTSAYVGWVRAEGSPTDQRCVLAYDTTQGDTYFMFECYDGTNTERVSSGVLADTAWHTLRIWSETTGQVKFSLDGGTAATLSAVSQTVAKEPRFHVITRENAAKQLKGYRFLFKGPYVE